jgi:hypothetical protein
MGKDSVEKVDGVKGIDMGRVVGVNLQLGIELAIAPSLCTQSITIRTSESCLSTLMTHGTLLCYTGIICAFFPPHKGKTIQPPRRKLQQRV